MKNISLLALFLIHTFHSIAQSKALKVLFIGNSYTAVNDLPNMFKSIADQAGDSVTAIGFMGGGQTLADHSNPNGPEMMEIRSGNWDIIILQEQSQLPAFPDDQVESSFFPYVHFLDSCAKAANPCVKTMLYMTWGRKNGDASNCQNFPPICTYQGMDSLLRLRYNTAAKRYNCIISPVGPVRKYLRTLRPEIELYEPDESHPSYAGTYAAACCFYASIFQKSPFQSHLNLNLDSSSVDHIKRAVDSVVLMQKDTWLLNAFQTKAIFTTQFLNDSIRINNMSSNADSFYWDFGDASTSSSCNPSTHHYAKGKFVIKLKVFSECGNVDSLSQEINIANSNLHPSFTSQIVAHPNPANQHIQFSFPYPVANYQLYNALGCLLTHTVHLKELSANIDLTDLPIGIYTLVVQDFRGNIEQIKFVKE